MNNHRNIVCVLLSHKFDGGNTDWWEEIDLMAYALYLLRPWFAVIDPIEVTLVRNY